MRDGFMNIKQSIPELCCSVTDMIIIMHRKCAGSIRAPDHRMA